MAARVRLAALVEVSLRVPPLFVVDELLKLSLGLPVQSQTQTQAQTEREGLEPVDQSANFTLDQLPAYSALAFLYEEDAFKSLVFAFAKCALYCTGCLLALSMFLLKMKHLIVMYMFLSSLALVFVSYWMNVSAMKTITELPSNAESSVLEDLLSLDVVHLMRSDGAGAVLLLNYFIQSILVLAFYSISLGPNYGIFRHSTLWSFTLPSLLATLPLPTVVLQHSSVFATVLPLSSMYHVCWSASERVVLVVSNGYHKAKTYASNFGVSALIEREWLRLNVPNVLRMFWILRVIEHLVILLMDNYELSDDSFKTLLAVQTLGSMAKSLLITGCETITAVLGMTSVISFFCHHIGNFFQWVLLTDDEEERNIGTVSAILFYILALQTGLTSLNPEKRFIRLCRNFCLLFAALLHFVHNIVNPMLMSLSASHNPSAQRHVRALCVCAFLVIFPLLLLYYLWSSQPLTTWLLAVSAFSIEVIVKVFVSLMIYSLFLIDAYRSTFWEQLDDYVYYIRAFGNTIEFCFGIFLFFNGAWILLFESGGAIRALMMCIHAYFNIWCEARAGWNIFMKRRSAVNKINSLPEASETQLASLDDVCAICYQDMTSAKITKCNHYFHGVCLRKWLYIQDRCPLCHNIMYKVDKDSKDTESESSSEAEIVVNEHED